MNALLIGLFSVWNVFCQICSMFWKTILFICSCSLLQAQTVRNDLFGASVGIQLNIGTVVNSIGLKLNGYYSQYFYQFNAGSELRFILTSYGKRKNFFETRNAIGLALLTGNSNKTADFELNELNHNTQKDYGLAYTYIWYNDNKGTAQRSGGFGLHLKDFSILMENDVFAGQSKDRFRTGAFQMSYRYEDFKFSVGNIIWTGETAGSTWQKLPYDNCPSGFRILEDLPYGKTSHGILYGGVLYSLPYGQTVRMRIGVDSEQIRHSIQNRLIHDLIFLPKKVERNTPHYPRLDNMGCAVFLKSDIRKTKLFLQLGGNDNWSY
jgi:hypothetical protein